jgi:hypothetical protein
MSGRSFVVGAVLAASLTVGVAGTIALVKSRSLAAAAGGGAKASAPPAPAKAPVVTVVGKADADRLPADRVLLPAADSAECGGVVVCSHCQWGVGEVCHKDVLWNEAKHHVVFLLPNEKLAELQEKLTPK